jgi:large subunit ribosomal protein L33
VEQPGRKGFFSAAREDVLFYKKRKIPKTVAMGGAVMRVKITLACTECKQRNYNTMKNKKNDPDRLEMNKYCRFCKKHTVHRETK